MAGALVKSLVSTISIIINGSLFATLLSSNFKFAADNVMLLHYFAFNIAANSFSILGNPYCSLHGYGQELSHLGSMLALMLITYRFTSFSKMSSMIWAMLICTPVLFLAFLSLQDEGKTFTYSEKAGECVRGSDSDRAIWTVVVSFKIFLATLSLLLAFPASCSVYSSSNDVAERKRHAMLHLLTAIIFDAILSGIQTITQLVIDGSDFQRISHSVLYTISSIRLVFVPLLLLSLHSGIRNSFFLMLGYGNQSVTQRMRQQLQTSQSFSSSHSPSRTFTQEFKPEFKHSLSNIKSGSCLSINSGSSNPESQPLHNNNSVEMLRDTSTRSRAASNSRALMAKLGNTQKLGDGQKGDSVSILIMDESLKAALNPKIAHLSANYKSHKMTRSTEF